MSNTPPMGGASVRARVHRPAVDLPRLVEALADAIPAPTGGGRSLFTYYASQNRLLINTHSVLARLAADKPKFQSQFIEGGPDKGFVRDCPKPSAGTDARVGGHLVGDSGTLAKAVTKLKKAVEDALSGSTQDKQLRPLSAREVFQDLAARHLGKGQQADAQLTSTVVPLQFASADRSVGEKENDAARIISAIETIQAEDWASRLAKAITSSRQVTRSGLDEDDIDSIVSELSEAVRKPGSQLTRFMNFLEEEALARIRLQVTLAIMSEVRTLVSNSSKSEEQLLHAYISHVLALRERYVGTKVSLTLDLSRAYGQTATPNLSEELRKSMFHGCLPVWPESNAQLFETRAADPVTGGVSVSREVSYRFRINGKNPEGKHAFNARLERIRSTLIDEPNPSVISPYRVNRMVAEAVFLWLVIPADERTLSADELVSRAEALTDRLYADPRNALAEVLADLESRADKVKRIGAVLVDILRRKGKQLLANTQRDVAQLYLVVKGGIVNWEAIKSGDAREPFIKAGNNKSENVAWFEHLEVVPNAAEVPGNLFSVQIKTTLEERMLALAPHDELSLGLKRDISGQIFPVRWLPIRIDPDDKTVTPRVSGELLTDWKFGADANHPDKPFGGIDVLYDPETGVKYRPDVAGKLGEETHRQQRAAMASALAILVNVGLETVAKNAMTDKEPATFLMLRFQEQGQEAHENEGDQIIYAVSQAVETSLGYKTPTRMQGLVLGKASIANLKYKKQGVVAALTAAFPLCMTGLPAAERLPVAAVIYNTRPCDEHPANADSTGYLYLMKTYLANPDEENGYRLRADRCQSHVVWNKEDFQSPEIVLEEIARLKGLGYEHILLISNHFGNRRIGRAAERHAPHTQAAFMDEVAAQFPGLFVYPLRRDVFPATRLHRRRDEAAFEIARVSEHQDMVVHKAQTLYKELKPIYTFATLSVVGSDATESQRPQSGFCTYFLDTQNQGGSLEWNSRVETNIVLPESPVRNSLLAVLRGLHFLEAEKTPYRGMAIPVLDPFTWVQPASQGAAGEIVVFPASKRGRSGNVILSIRALLAHVTDALHKEAPNA